MTITINDVELNKLELVHLINNNKKITAIKLLKDKLGISLKDCKIIADNLEKNPHFYDGKFIEIGSTQPNVDATNISNSRSNRGSHIIKPSPNYKNYLIVFLLACIILLIFLYVSK